MDLHYVFYYDPSCSCKKYFSWHWQTPDTASSSQRMDLSVWYWNPGFHPQQSGHHNPLPWARQSRQLSERYDHVRTYFYKINFFSSIFLIFSLAAVQRLLRCIFIQWRVFCFMLDTNPLSRFGIDRDMVWKRNESCLTICANICI